MLILSFLYWKCIDLYRYIRDTINKTRKIHIYGIEGFFGLPGHGKTMCLVYRAEQYRKKYGDKIYISSNFGYKGEDFAIEGWQDLLKPYDRPVIFLYDEIQNEFCNREYKKFPIELLTLLTQNRKGHGKKILYTAQRQNRVDLVFRELTNTCWDCKTFAGRLTWATGYDDQSYEQLKNTISVDRKIMIHKRERFWFVQTDKIRDLYDSYQQLESALKKEKMTREEINKTIVVSHTNKTE